MEQRRTRDAPSSDIKIPSIYDLRFTIYNFQLSADLLFEVDRRLKVGHIAGHIEMVFDNGKGLVSLIEQLFLLGKRLLLTLVHC